jgi:quercetin dioxygenase-like cupin family protein
VTATISAPAQRSFYHPLQKDTATFLETCEESGGARTLIEVELAPRGGNAAHRHLTYAERFEALDGPLTVRVDDAVRRLEPGETATAAEGSLHCFSNPTDEPVTFLVELTPGHAGFERALQVGYGLARDGLTRKDGVPRSLYQLALLLEWSDIRLPGAMRALGPVVRLLARRARRKGVERTLVERYCALS